MLQVISLQLRTNCMSFLKEIEQVGIKKFEQLANLMTATLQGIDCILYLSY